MKPVIFHNIINYNHNYKHTLSSRLYFLTTPKIASCISFQTDLLSDLRPNPRIKMPHSKTPSLSNAASDKFNKQDAEAMCL